MRKTAVMQNRDKTAGHAGHSKQAAKKKQPKPQVRGLDKVQKAIPMTKPKTAKSNMATTTTPPKKFRRLDDASPQPAIVPSPASRKKKLSARESPIGGFAKAVAEYKSHLAESIPKRLESAHSAVKLRLQQATETTESHIQEYNKLKRPLEQPLGQEMLIITQKKGKPDEQKTTVTLEARMAQFKQVLEEESTKISRLRQDLKDMDKQISTLADEMHVDDATSGSKSKQVATTYGAAVAKLQASLRAKQEEHLARFERESREVLGRLESSERHHQSQARVAKRKFEQLLLATMEEQDELAE